MTPEEIKIAELLVRHLRLHSYIPANEVMNVIQGYDMYKGKSITWYPVLNYLTHLEFIIYEPFNGIYSLKLTEKGKDLKAQITIEKYYLWEKEQSETSTRRRKMEDVLLENHVHLTTEQKRIEKTNRVLTWLFSGLGVAVAIASPFISSYMDDKKEAEVLKKLDAYKYETHQYIDSLRAEYHVLSEGDTSKPNPPSKK